MNKITSFEEACKARGVDPNVLPDVSMLPDKHRKSFIAFYKLIIIAEALNEGWEPNWNDSRQYKYYPWLYVQASNEKSAGFGLSSSYDVRTRTGASVGSRLCFKTSELAMYAGNTFKDLYTDYLLLT